MGPEPEAHQGPDNWRGFLAAPCWFVTNTGASSVLVLDRVNAASEWGEPPGAEGASKPGLGEE